MTAEKFWAHRCLGCGHPDHEMTCHELILNGDPSNGPAYCPCAVNIELMEMEIVRLRARAVSASSDAAGLRAAAEDVDRAWYIQSTGPDGVHLRYASDLPERLNGLRAALAATPSGSEQ